MNPQLQDLLQTFQSYSSGTSRIDDVLGKLSEFQKWRRSFKDFFSQFSFFEESKVLNSPPFPRIPKLLQSLKSHETEFEQFLRRQEIEKAGEKLQALREAAQKLFSTLREIREKEGGNPRYSRIPMIQEIVRLGIAVRSGDFEPGKYHKMLERTLAYHRAYYASFKEDAVRRPELYNSLWEPLRKGMKSIELHLNLLLEELQEGKVSQTSLNGLARSGDALLPVLEELAMARTGPDKLICFYCGRSNPPTSRFCEGCNTALPRFSA